MNRIKKIAAFFAATGLVSQASAAGFEKSVSWSAKEVSQGGAAVSSVTGANALYFNPAGLVGTNGYQVSANFSPTYTQAKGPLLQNDVTVTGVQQFSPVFGLLGSYGLSDNLAVGLGVFVTGGTKAVYDGVDFTGLNSAFTLTGTTKSDLSLIEISPGVAYKVAPGLKVGAAWRVSMVKGAFSSSDATDLGTLSSALTGSYIGKTVDVKGLSGNAYSGFRVGAQWAPEDANWGLGLNVRTAVNFTLKGTTAGSVQYRAGGASAAVLNGLNPDVKAITGGDATVTSELPTQVSLGGHWDVADKNVGLFLEYTWTNYGAVKSIAVSGNVTTASDVVNASQKAAINGAAPGAGTALGAAANSVTAALPNFATDWYDQHQIRLGSEFRYVRDYPIRAGYVLTSQVVPGRNARASFSSPGIGHTFALGTGTKFLNNALGVDLAVEYSLASGHSDGGTAAKSGDYSTRAIDLHASLAYAF